MAIEKINKQLGAKKRNRNVSKAKKTNSTSSIMDEPTTNEYLKKCKATRIRNQEKLAKVVEDIKERRKSPKRICVPARRSGSPKKPPKGKTTTPRKLECNAEQKTAAKKTKPVIKKTVGNAVTKKKTARKSANKKIVCKHDEFFQFKEEYDRRYFTEGNDMYRTKCASCKLEFGTKKDNPPTRNSPVWICINRTVNGCKHSYCGVCFYEKGQQNRDAMEGRRRMRSRK